MRVFYPAQPAAQHTMLAAALLQPAAILVDHGHFQYNNISLGFTVLTSPTAMLTTLASTTMGDTQGAHAGSIN
jgi:hypothetical protein